MKSVRIDEGKMKVEITPEDGELLHRMRKYLRPSLFNEDSIENLTTNSRGLIELSAPANVHYIRCMEFIPYEKFCEDLDITLHGKAWERAVVDYEGLHYLLHDTIESSRPMTRAQARYLKSIFFLEDGMVDKLLNLSLTSDEAYDVAREIGECLKLQGQNYIEVIFNTYEAKRQRTETETAESDTKANVMQLVRRYGSVKNNKQ